MSEDLQPHSEVRQDSCYRQQAHTSDQVWKSAWGNKYGLDWFGRSDRSKLLALLSSWRAELLTEAADGTLAMTTALDVISEDMAHFKEFGKHTDGSIA